MSKARFELAVVQTAVNILGHSALEMQKKIPGNSGTWLVLEKPSGKNSGGTLKGARLRTAQQSVSAKVSKEYAVVS